MTDEAVARLLMKSFTQFKRLAKGHYPAAGLKPSEIGLLYHLKSDHKDNPAGMRITELSDLLKVTPSSITQLVTSLEAMSLVERKMDSEDRRSVLVSLTDKGEEVTKQAYEHLISIFLGLVEHFGHEKSIMLSQLLNEMVDYLSGLIEKEPMNLNKSIDIRH